MSDYRRAVVDAGHETLRRLLQAARLGDLGRFSLEARVAGELLLEPHANVATSPWRELAAVLAAGTPLRAVGADLVEHTLNLRVADAMAAHAVVAMIG